MKRLIPLLGLLISFVGCNNFPTETADGNRYATLFRTDSVEGEIAYVVSNPWDTSQDLARIPHGKTFGRAIVQSSVHAKLLLELGVIDSVVGIFEGDYVVDTLLRNTIAEHHIVDLGNSMQPDVERIAALHPDVLLLSPFENCGYGAIEALNVPIIPCADYMETSPLGRAEWVKLYGRLFGIEERADSLFNAVCDNYLQLSADTLKGKRPTLIVDLPQGDKWLMPGGQSYLAQIYRDAGFDYILSSHSQAGSVTLSLEEMYLRGNDADIWLIKYGQSSDWTYEELLRDNPNFQHFKAFREHRVWGCNTFRTPYFEQIPFHPEILLRNLKTITRSCDTSPSFYSSLR